MLRDLYAPKWHIHWVLVICFIECWSCAPLSQPFKCLLHAHLESCGKVGFIQSWYTTQVSQGHTNWAKHLLCKCSWSRKSSEAHQRLYLRELISTCVHLPSALRLCYEEDMLAWAYPPSAQYSKPYCSPQYGHLTYWLCSIDKDCLCSLCSSRSAWLFLTQAINLPWKTESFTQQSL